MKGILRSVNREMDCKLLEMNSTSICQHEDELKRMLVLNTYIYHYPDKEVDMAFINARFDQLQSYLKEGNTFFIAAFHQERMVGYIWLYQRPFMNYKRMIINSFFVDEESRSQGIGRALLEVACRKSQEMQCSEIATHYSTENKRAGRFYMNNGFSETRVEVVKKL